MARSADQHGIRCSLSLEMAARKLTVRGLSEATGVHTGAISRLRSNHFSMIDCMNLERICRYLKSSLANFWLWIHHSTRRNPDGSLILALASVPLRSGIASLWPR